MIYQLLRLPIKQWFQRYALKLVALAFWLLLLGGYQWYAWHQGLNPFQAVPQLLGFMTGSFWGPFIYIGLYALRPLNLFPSTVLTIAGGFIFGPVLGVIYTKIIPVLLLGPRSLDMAMAVVHGLRHSMQPDCAPVFTTDGLKLWRPDSPPAAGRCSIYSVIPCLDDKSGLRNDLIRGQFQVK